MGSQRLKLATLTDLQCAAGLRQRPRDIQQFLNRDKISSCQMTTDYSEQ